GMAAIGVIAATYFVLSSNTTGKYVSPDETANAFFATQFATEHTSQKPLPDDVESLPLDLHPRSTGIVDGSVRSLSFVGLPFIAGFMGMVFGVWIIPFVTAIF